MKEKNKANTTQ